jgi:hypothetical protein
MQPGPKSDPKQFDTFVDAVFDPLLVALADQEQQQQPTQQQQQTQQQSQGAPSASPDLELGTPHADVRTELTFADEASNEVDDGGSWEVEKILNHRQTPAGRNMYLLKWKGHSRKYNSWEPESSLHCPRLVKQYHKEHKRAKRSIMLRARHAKAVKLACFEAALRLPEAPTPITDEPERSCDQHPTADPRCHTVHQTDLIAVAELMAKQGLTGDPEE